MRWHPAHFDEASPRLVPPPTKARKLRHRPIFPRTTVLPLGRLAVSSRCTMTILRQRPWLTLLLALLPVALTALAFVWVLSLREPASAPLFRSQLPHEAFDPARCTWACHNHGCQHQPQLPAWLASDEGLFGRTVAALHHGGRILLPKDPRAGYGLVNLLVFCLFWPGLMWALYLIAINQFYLLIKRK